jgi:hypothetical protein
VPAYVEVWDTEALKVAGVDISSDHPAMFTNLLGQPFRHGSTACTYFKTPPAWLDQGASLTRKRIEDLFEQAEPFIFHSLTTFRRKTIAGK